MKIVVCVKQILYAGVPFEIDEARGIAKQKEPVPVNTVNQTDRYALEEAIKLRDRFGGQVTALTVGPERSKQAVISCLAGGADEGIHLLGGSSMVSDYYTTAFALSQAIRDLNANIILCGTKSLDEGGSQVPPALAELLSLPQVTGVVRLEVGGDVKRAKVVRRLERGKREILECPLPAVIAVDIGINNPRYISIHNLEVASTREIVKHDLGLSGLVSDEGDKVQPLTRVLRVAQPRTRLKKMAAPDSSMSPAERLKFIMCGGISQKDRELLDGPIDRLVQKVVKFLQDESLV